MISKDKGGRCGRIKTRVIGGGGGERQREGGSVSAHHNHF